MPKRLQEAGIKYQKGGEKNYTVKVRRKGRVTKVKNEHGKFKEKTKKDGTVKQVSWIDGKRTVDKFTRIPEPDWKDLTPKRQAGGQAIIKKEAAKHGASASDTKYAQDLYAGATKDQQKKAMGMYDEYSKTGKIPDGAVDLYKAAGGNRFARKGGAVGPNRIL